MLHKDNSVFLFLQRWFKKLPPVLTFELSRFEFNTQLGRPEKIHKKLEFPPIIYMDRWGVFSTFMVFNMEDTVLLVISLLMSTFRGLSYTVVL